MKQHITIEQWSEFERGHKALAHELRVWLDKLDYPVSTDSFVTYNTQPAFRRLSIGRMIEFLGDEWINKINYVYGADSDDLIKLSNTFDDEYFPKPHFLCDALWEACKESLNEITIDS